MEQQDRQAIEGLFSRLENASRQAGPRDAEAEAFISQQIARQPGAAYFMAQTIIMQEYAMQDAQRRIEALEQQAQRPSGGFLSGLFGGGGNRAPVPQRPAAPMPMGMQPQPGRGGGFLAGAAQTAMGVAGGVLLGNAIAGMFSDAQAAEPPAEPAPEEDPGFAEDDGSDMEW